MTSSGPQLEPDWPQQADSPQPFVATLCAYAGLERLVGIDSLVAAMGESLPAYRSQHRVTNERALRAGFAAGEAAA